MVKRLLFTMFATALCVMWIPPVSASVGCGHEQEIKQFVCSMPVMVEYQIAISLQSTEAIAAESATVHSYDKLSSMPYVILEKRCFRISRGKLFSRHRNFESKSKTGESYQSPVNVFRLYNFRC